MSWHSLLPARGSIAGGGCNLNLDTRELGVDCSTLEITQTPCTAFWEYRMGLTCSGLAIEAQDLLDLSTTQHPGGVTKNIHQPPMSSPHGPACREMPCAVASDLATSTARFTNQLFHNG